MRVFCNVHWLDGEVSDVIFVVNTVSFNNGLLSIYPIENDDTYFVSKVPVYDFQSYKRKLLEDGFAYMGSTFYEKIWESEEVL